MVQFVEQYSSIEKITIDFVDKEKAATRDSKMLVLKQQEIDNQRQKTEEKTKEDKKEKKRSASCNSAVSSS